MVPVELRLKKRRDLISVMQQVKHITERKRAEKEFENTFNLSPDMLGIFTTGGELIRTNPSWETILGYKTEELLEVGWANLVHPDDVERTNKEMEEQLKGSFIILIAHSILGQSLDKEVQNESQTASSQHLVV